MNTNMKELTLNEMEKVVGGGGGSRNPLPEKEGLFVYQLQPGDTLTKLSRRYNTTVDYLKFINPSIHDANNITSGYYIYVPE